MWVCGVGFWTLHTPYLTQCTVQQYYNLNFCLWIEITVKCAMNKWIVNAAQSTQSLIFTWNNSLAFHWASLFSSSFFNCCHFLLLRKLIVNHTLYVGAWLYVFHGVVFGMKMRYERISNAHHSSVLFKQFKIIVITPVMMTIKRSNINEIRARKTQFYPCLFVWWFVFLVFRLRNRKHLTIRQIYITEYKIK